MHRLIASTIPENAECKLFARKRPRIAKTASQRRLRRLTGACIVAWIIFGSLAVRK
jgi:hypothetical protein